MASSVTAGSRLSWPGLAPGSGSFSLAPDSGLAADQQPSTQDGETSAFEANRRQLPLRIVHAYAATVDYPLSWGYPVPPDDINCLQQTLRSDAEVISPSPMPPGLSALLRELPVGAAGDRPQARPLT